MIKFIAILSIAYFLVGCNINTPSENTSQEPEYQETAPDSAQEAQIELDSEGNISVGDNFTDYVNEDRLEVFRQFEKGLEELGLEYSNYSTLAEDIGAIESIRYRFENGTLEIVVFDKNSNIYAEIETTGQITLESTGQTLELDGVRNGLILLMDDMENKEDILRIFNSLEA